MKFVLFSLSSPVTHVSEEWRDPDTCEELEGSSRYTPEIKINGNEALYSA